MFDFPALAVKIQQVTIQEARSVSRRTRLYIWCALASVLPLFGSHVGGQGSIGFGNYTPPTNGISIFPTNPVTIVGPITNWPPPFTNPPPVLPLNDDFANAITLTGSVIETNANNLGATTEPGEPYHRGYPATRSIWWRWTAPADGLVQAELSQISIPGAVSLFAGGENSEMRLSVYSGAVLADLQPVPLLPAIASHVPVLQVIQWGSCPSIVFPPEVAPGADGFEASLGMELPPEEDLELPLPA